MKTKLHFGKAEANYFSIRAEICFLEALKKLCPKNNNFEPACYSPTCVEKYMVMIHLFRWKGRSDIWLHIFCVIIL